MDTPRHRFVHPFFHWSLSRFLVIALVVVLSFSVLGIALPETGFDALWYHLPIAASMIENRAVVTIPTLYQSTEPRLGEMLFVPWLAVGGVTGVKIWMFLQTLVLLWLVYCLARHFLPKEGALLVVVCVAAFHTVAWEATSAYVDQLRAIFELCALVFIVKKRSFVLTGAALGLSLATKSVALPFLLPWVFIACPMSLLLGFLMAAPWQLSGILVFRRVGGDLIVHTPKGILGWLGSALLGTLLLPLTLAFHAESYLSPLFLWAVPWLRWSAIRPNIRLWLFCISSLFVWQLIVPVSVRYDLSAIILLSVLLVSLVWHSGTTARKLLVLVILSGVLFHCGVRLLALKRDLPFLLGRESRTEYLRSFDTGILKGPLESWYGKL